LPILKSTINKLANALTPQGFILFSNKGKEVGARQAVFHLHVVPE